MRPVLDGDGFYYCVGGRTAFGLRAASPGNEGERFDQGRVGLHHICFRVREREHVDEIFDFVRERGAHIVHPPEEGPFAPGYYSVLFEDPDFPRERRDSVYYVRAIEAPLPTLNAGGLRCETDEAGRCVEPHPCDASAGAEPCAEESEPRAWSSPIFVDYGR